MPILPLALYFNQNASQTLRQNKLRQLGYAFSTVECQLELESLPLLSISNIDKSSYSKNKQSHIAYRTQVLNSLFTELLPLLEGEKEQLLVENLFILSKQWRNIDAETPVIYRMTNYADYYFLAPTVHFSLSQHHITLYDHLAFRENVVLSPVNILLTSDVFVNFLLKINMVFTESVHGYGFNHLLSFRFAVIPEHLSFHALLSSKNDYMPNLDDYILEQHPNLSFLWVHFKKMVKIAKICEDTVDEILQTSIIFEEIAKDIVMQKGSAQRYSPYEILFVFLINLVLTKDMKLYQVSLEKNCTNETLKESLSCLMKQYIKLLSLRARMNSNTNNHDVLTEILTTWKVFCHNEIAGFDWQYAKFHANDVDKYQRTMFYSKDIFLEQINNHKGKVMPLTQDSSHKLLFDYALIEDFYSNLPLPLARDEIRDLFAERFSSALDKVILDPVIRTVQEKMAKEAKGELSNFSKSSRLKSTVKFNRSAVKEILKDYMDMRKKKSEFKNARATGFGGGMEVELAPYLREGIRRRGLSVLEIDSSAVATEELAVVAEFVGIGSSAVAIVIVIMAVSVMAALSFEAEESLEQSIKKQQEDILAEYNRITKDLKSSQEKKEKIKQDLDIFNNNKIQVRDELKKTDAAIHELMVKSEKYFIGTVHKVTDTYDRSGNKFNEIVIDAVKLKYFIAEGTNNFYNSLINGLSLFDAIDEINLPSYMIRVYTSQDFSEDSWCVFKCDEKKNDKVSVGGILDKTEDLSSGKSIIDRYTMALDFRALRSYLVADDVFGYMGQVIEPIKTPLEALEDELMKKIGLDTIADILDKTSQKLSITDEIERFLEQKKSIVALAKNSTVQVDGMAMHKIKNALERSLKGANAEEVKLHNVGQASCASVYDQDSRFAFYYDFGYSYDKNRTKEEVRNNNDKITSSLFPNDLIVLSHWDYDHFKLGLVDISNKRNRDGTVRPNQVTWIVPESKKKGVALNRLKDSLGNMIEWPSSGFPSITVQNITLYKASGKSPNNSGICLSVSHDGVPWFLHPADASYFYIPFNAALPKWSALVATHHASKRSILSGAGSRRRQNALDSDTDIPPAVENSQATLYYTYGQGNPYRHDETQVAVYYQSKGWNHSARTFDDNQASISIINPGRVNAGFFATQKKAEESEESKINILQAKL